MLGGSQSRSAGSLTETSDPALRSHRLHHLWWSRLISSASGSADTPRTAVRGHPHRRVTRRHAHTLSQSRAAHSRSHSGRPVSGSPLCSQHGDDFWPQLRDIQTSLEKKKGKSSIMSDSAAGGPSSVRTHTHTHKPLVLPVLACPLRHAAKSHDVEHQAAAVGTRRGQSRSSAL